jgi:hypothetical protein
MRAAALPIAAVSAVVMAMGLLDAAHAQEDDANACEAGAHTSIFAIVESVEERSQDNASVYRISLGRAQGDCTVQYVNVAHDPRPACDTGKTLSATGVAQLDADGAPFVQGPESFSCQ